MSVPTNVPDIRPYEVICCDCDDNSISPTSVELVDKSVVYLTDSEKRCDRRNWSKTFIIGGNTTVFAVIAACKHADVNQISLQLDLSGDLPRTAHWTGDWTQLIRLSTPVMLSTSNFIATSFLVNSSLTDVGMTTTHVDGGVVNSSNWATWTTRAGALTNASSSTKTPLHWNATSGLTLRTMASHTAEFVTMQHGNDMETTTSRVTEELLGIGNSRLTVLTVYLTVAFSIILFVVLFMWICCRSHERFRQISISRDQLYEYIYSPLHRSDQDDEYENTYVGISIPLLQDNTKV